MANEWTLTGPGGALVVHWPAAEPFSMQATVVGVSERVFGRPKPVFRHYAGNIRFTLHHIISDRTAGNWDNLFGQARNIMLILAGNPYPATVDFMAQLTGPDSYASEVRIVGIRPASPQPPFARMFTIAIDLEEATL